MSTYLEVQDRINSDHLNRTGFTAETRRAIKAAVRRYERTNWSFNEASTAMATVAGQSYVSLPSDFLVLDDLRLVVNNENLPLMRRGHVYVRDMNMAGNVGQPTDFAFYNNRFELALVPDSAWTANVYYLKSLPVLSADIDTNEWIQGAMEDLIVYHASKLMWANVLRNEKEAVKFAQLERTALNTVEARHEQNRLSGLTPTRF